MQIYIDCPAPPPPYSSFFGLSTAGSNLYIFATWSHIQSNNWIAACRLAAFEQLKLSDLFTYHLLSEPSLAKSWADFGITPFCSEQYRGTLRYEGFLSVKVAYTNQWKDYYVVATSIYTPPEDLESHRIGSMLFQSKRSKNASERGLLLFYASKNTKKAPVFMIKECSRCTCIIPEDRVDFSAAASAAVYGKLEVVGKSSNDQPNRTLEQHQDGYQVLSNSFSDICNGKDNRPAISRVFIRSDSTGSLANWMIAIFGSFSIDAGVPQLLQTIEHIESNQTSLWPTQLFLSLAEISGVQMDKDMLETILFFEHYLKQKTMFCKQRKLRIWSESIARGEWERNLVDRREAETRINQLTTWIKQSQEILKSHGKTANERSMQELVGELTSEIPSFGPAFVSMMGDTVPIGVAAALSISDSASNMSSKRSYQTKSTTADGDGSVSESDDTSEGSLSEEESSPEIGSEIKSLVSHTEVESEYDDELEQEQNQAGLYNVNSLLHQLAIDGPRHTKADGLLINAVPDSELVPGADPEYAANTLVARQPGQALNKGIGPLLGAVNPEKYKPKLQDGLLGEVNRREREKALRKKGANELMSELDREYVCFKLEQKTIIYQMTVVALSISAPSYSKNYVRAHLTMQ